MLGCLIGLIAFFTPRIAILLLIVFSDWIQSCFRHLSAPFSGLLLPILGLLFVPYTLLAYCLAYHQTHGRVGGLWIVLIVVAVLFDLGVIGHGRRSRRRAAKRVE